MVSPKLPKTIWILGFVSLFMDVSSEMVHGVLPIFLTTVLGASYAQVGLIDGVGSGVALFFKVLSGPLSDYLKHKKYLVMFGYLLGAVSKPLFALATTPHFVFATHVVDRMGKGIRGAPRDALIAEITPAELRGQAFGLRQALDTVGAFLGPLLAIVLLSAFATNLRLLFWIALIPGLISVLLIFLGVEEPKTILDPKPVIEGGPLKRFSKNFWEACGIAFVLQLAKLGDVFLILRTKDFGLNTQYLPGVLILMNFIYAMTSYPAGSLSDRLGRKRVISLGFLILFVANLLLATSSSLLITGLAIALWGIQLGLTQGNLVALVTDTSPPHLRGTALGVFNFFSAIAMVIGGSGAGFLWDHFGASTTFLTAGSLAFLGLVLFQIQKKLS